MTTQNITRYNKKILSTTVTFTKNYLKQDVFYLRSLQTKYIYLVPIIEKLRFEASFI